MPVYTCHRIEIYEPAHSLHAGDVVHFRSRVAPRDDKQKKRDLTAEVVCSKDGRKVYKIGMDLKFVPRSILKVLLSK